MSDAEIVIDALQGNAASFEQLVTAYSSAIYRFHTRLTGDRSAAEDLTQTTFVSAYRSLSRLKDPSKFRAWLYGIARHQAMNYNTRQAYHQNELLDPSDLSNMPASQPEQTPLETKELMDAIDQAISRLPEDLRAPLLLTAIDGLTYDETALTLDIPLGTVKSRIARARARLVGEIGNEKKS
jgi:RNA polymerase sigma-70 factor (ECF subfamily)